ncbi:glutathione S-transferase [Biscogniauxia mediterranea]|nr:glutathione S-transferase [Biscogniauxia mediterranea]
MAPFGKIYSYPDNFRVQRAQLLAELNGLELPLAEGFKMGETNKTPEFLAKFPMGKVPALECADGFCLAESAAIARYVAQSGPLAEQLLGADAKTQARIAEWTCFAESELSSNMIPPIAMAVMKLMPADKARFDSSMANLERALKRIEKALEGGKKFLVGDKITMADVMVAGSLYVPFKFMVDAEMRKGLPNLVSYVQGVASTEAAKKVYGDLVMCDTRVSL